MRYLIIIALAFLLMGTSCEDGNSTGPGSEYNIVNGICVVDETGTVIREVGTPYENEDHEIEFGGPDESIIIMYPNMKLYPNPNNGHPYVRFTVPEDMNCKVWIENAYPSDSLNAELNNFFNIPDSKEKNVIKTLSDEHFEAGNHTLVWRTEEQSIQQGFYRIFLEMGDDTYYMDILILYEDIPGYHWFGEY